jgi:hypothetical protein
MVQSINNTNTYDVCIIGAGPAGLSVLSAIMQPAGILKHEHQWNQNRVYNKATNESNNKRQLSVCVIDPSGKWLTDWCGRFKSLGIDKLRSPTWATPEYFGGGYGLMEFANQMGRENELYNVEIPKNVVKDLREVAGAGLFQIPGSSLFEDFCESLVSRLKHSFVQGTAMNIDKQNDGSYSVNVNVAGNIEQINAGNIVFALGAAGAPNVPATMSEKVEHHPNNSFKTLGKKIPSSRIIHTLSWEKLMTTPFKGETVVVIGGGLSAAQAALLACKKGASRVLHVSRRPIHSRQYDLPFEWMDPRSGWRAAKKNQKGTTFRTFEFFETPKEGREAWIKNARSGATVPESYVKMLEKAACAGQLERLVDEISSCELCTAATNVIPCPTGNYSQSSLSSDCLVAGPGTCSSQSKFACCGESFTGAYYESDCPVGIYSDGAENGSCAADPGYCASKNSNDCVGTDECNFGAASQLLSSTGRCATGKKKVAD